MYDKIHEKKVVTQEGAMEIAAIKKKRDEIINIYGPWTAHNIRLADGVFTIDKPKIASEIGLRRVVQIVSDITNERFEDLRILDLACLEGMYAIELALQGATVVGIEGRQTNIEKAKFVKELFSLKNLEFYEDDVRNLSREKYGSFDVVLCLGILYHLDVPDVFRFMKKIVDVCQKVAIIDTHISLAAKKSFVFEGRKYWGKTFKEHDPRSTIQERKNSLWASLDNVTSFWLTYHSLSNLLIDVGFTSAYECKNPPEPKKPRDRITLVALKNKCLQLNSTSQVPESAQKWPEVPTFFKTRFS